MCMYYLLVWYWVHTGTRWYVLPCRPRRSASVGGRPTLPTYIGSSAEEGDNCDRIGDNIGPGPTDVHNWGAFKPCAIAAHADFELF